MSVRQPPEKGPRSRRSNASRAQARGLARSLVTFIETGLVVAFLLVLLGSLSLAIALATKVTSGADIV